MDELDYRIYRYLSLDGMARFWGSRRLLDPRVSAREIAEKVSLSEAGVRARLRSLKARGFLRGTESCLNPGLFDASLIVAEIPVRDSSEAERLLGELSLVEGVTFARDVLDEENRKVRVHYISDTSASTARRTALLRRLAPGGQLRGPSSYWIPPVTRVLTSLDWRMLRAIRTTPEATLAELAQNVGVSLKTTGSRFHLLLDANACWWTPDSASEEMPLALLTLNLAERTNRSAIALHIERENPTWIPVAPDGFGLPPSTAGAPIVGLMSADSPAALERGVRHVRTLDGVTGLHRTFALGSNSYPQWLDEHLAARLIARS